MFDFQKEVILNSIEEPMVCEVKDPAGEEVIGVRVDGMVYKYGSIGKVHLTMPVEGEKAEITLKVADFEGGKKQLRIELGLDKDYRGEFGSALFYFRKPIVLDARAELDAESLYGALVKLCASNGNVLKVKEAAPADTLTLVASDSYITVRKAEIVTFACDDSSCSGESMEVEAEVKDLKEAQVKDNVAEFGTYDYMIHNLRLPTYANLRFASPAAVEMPMPGVKYAQLSFEYTVDRRLGGLSVAGQKTQSTTIHTFFVPSDKAEGLKKKLMNEEATDAAEGDESAQE